MRTQCEPKSHIVAPENRESISIALQRGVIPICFDGYSITLFPVVLRTMSKRTFDI